MIGYCKKNNWWLKRQLVHLHISHNDYLLVTQSTFHIFLSRGDFDSNVVVAIFFLDVMPNTKCHFFLSELNILMRFYLPWSFLNRNTNCVSNYNTTTDILMPLKLEKYIIVCDTLFLFGPCVYYCMTYIHAYSIRHFLWATVKYFMKLTTLYTCFTVCRYIMHIVRNFFSG